MRGRFMRIWLYLLGIIASLFTVIYKISEIFYSHRLELDELNLLYECKECGKFHRRYQEEIQIRLDKNYPAYHHCPRCYGKASLYHGEEYPWMLTNPEAPKLRWRDVKKIKRIIHDVERYRLEDESIEKFLYYYRLIPEENKRPPIIESEEKNDTL